MNVSRSGVTPMLMTRRLGYVAWRRAPSWLSEPSMETVNCGWPGSTPDRAGAVGAADDWEAASGGASARSSKKGSSCGHSTLRNAAAWAAGRPDGSLRQKRLVRGGQAGTDRLERRLPGPGPQQPSACTGGEHAAVGGPLDSEFQRAVRRKDRAQRRPESFGADGHFPGAAQGEPRMPGQRAEHLQKPVAVHERHAGRQRVRQLGQLFDDPEIFRQERLGRQAGRAEQPALAGGGDFQADEKLIFAPRSDEVRREDDVQAGFGV